MGSCDSAVNQESKPTFSTKKSVNSVKKLVAKKTQYSEFTSTVFDKYDKDKSGYIEKSDLREVINDMAETLNIGHDISQDDVKKILETIETKEDGKISKEEFTKLSREKLLDALR